MQQSDHKGVDIDGEPLDPNRIKVFSPWDVRDAAELAILSFGTARSVLHWARLVTESAQTRNAPDPIDDGRYVERNPLIRLARAADQLDLCIDNGYAFSQEELWEIERYMDVFSEGPVGWGGHFSPSAMHAAFGYAHHLHDTLRRHRTSGPAPTWAATAAQLRDRRKEFKLSIPPSRVESNIHLEAAGALKQYAQVDATIMVRRDIPLVSHNLSVRFSMAGFCLRDFAAARNGEDPAKAADKLRSELPEWISAGRHRGEETGAMQALVDGEDEADALPQALAEFRLIVGSLCASKNLRGLVMTRIDTGGFKEEGGDDQPRGTGVNNRSGERPTPHTFPNANWLMPPLPLATIAKRLRMTPQKATILLKQFHLQNWGTRQDWTVKLDDMPKSLRERVNTPATDEDDGHPGNGNGTRQRK